MKSLWRKWIIPPWPWQTALMVLLLGGTVGFYVGVWTAHDFGTGGDSPINLTTIGTYIALSAGLLGLIGRTLHKKSQEEEIKIKKRQQLSPDVFSYLLESRTEHLIQCDEVLKWAELYSTSRGPDKTSPPIPNRKIIEYIESSFHGSTVQAATTTFPHRPDYINGVFKSKWAFSKGQVQVLEQLEDNKKHTDLIHHLPIELKSLDSSTDWERLEDFFRTLMTLIESYYSRCKLYDKALAQWREDGAALPSQRREAQMARLSTTEIFTRIASVKHDAHQVGIAL